MKLSEVQDLAGAVGVRVRSLRDFSGVPKGTEGVVDEFYAMFPHVGVMVAWDLPDWPLPAGYRAYDGRPAVLSRLIRDGFGRGEFDETCYLEVVGGSTKTPPKAW